MGQTMRDRLTGKQVNLDALVENLKEFFDTGSFITIVKSESHMYKIVALPKTGSNLCDSIEVLIEGGPDDFTVQFGESENYSRKFTFFGSLMSMLGGGAFLKKGLRSQEELDKLENDFWVFFDAKIVSLEKK